MTIKQKTVVLVMIPVVLIGVLAVIGLNPEYEKVLEHKGHRIEYAQYLRGEKFLYVGHYVTNEKLVDQAYMKLANRLLDDYLRNKDSQLIDEVVKIGNDHNLRYRNRMKAIDVDSLIRNRDTLLDTIIWIR